MIRTPDAISIKKPKRKNAQAAPAGAQSPPHGVVKDIREQLELSQAAASLQVHVAMRTWQQWEQGIRKMPPGLWELFLLKNNYIA